MQDAIQKEELACLRGVTSDTLGQLIIFGELICLRRKAPVYRAGERQEYLYFLVAGQAILYTLTKHGERKIIFILGPGEMLNESVIHTERTTVFCDVIRDSRIFRIPVRRFLEFMRADFSLTSAVLEIQERKLWRTSHQLKNTTGSLHLEKKLAAKLWKLARDFPKAEANPARKVPKAEENLERAVPKSEEDPARTVPKMEEKTARDFLQEETESVQVRPKAVRKFPYSETPETVTIDVDLTVTFLADFLGAPRETTSRVCRSLTERGYIRVEKRQVTVLDMKGLSEFYRS